MIRISAQQLKGEQMKRVFGGLVAVAILMAWGTDTANAAPGDSICATYNKGNAPGNTFYFSEYTWGNYFQRTGHVWTLDAESCGEPIGTYTYYPWYDYTEFTIWGPTDNYGYFKIHGYVIGQKLFGEAYYFNHCFYSTGAFILTPCEDGCDDCEIPG